MASFWCPSKNIFIFPGKFLLVGRSVVITIMTYLPQHIALLIYRRSTGAATQQELAELEQWAADSPLNLAFLQQVANGETWDHWLQQEELDKQSGLQQQLLQRIMTDIAGVETAPEAPVVTMQQHASFLRAGWFRFAAVLLLVATGIVFLLQRQTTGSVEGVAPVAITAYTGAPGKSKAIETSSDGYKTVTTPKGGEYRLVLPDGTKVWLNASSSIRFPLSFATERRVSVTGEVYMEVVASARYPFRVNAKQRVITVLGTRFNINAYEDEPTLQATLLSGKIRLSNQTQELVLSPGQVATIPEAGPIQTQRADTVKVTAWKNGWFNFEDAGIEQIMNQLKRWYDIEVRYEGVVPSRHYSGSIERVLPLRAVLDMLQKTNIHFKIEGRVVTVLP